MDQEFDWLVLDDEEEVVWSATPHPYSLLPAFVVGLLLAVVLVGVFVVVWAYLAHRNTDYVVTSDALYTKTGVLSRSVNRIGFGKVQDTSYRQNVLGARYGYGTVDVSTAGGGVVEMSLANVAEPRRTQSLINERLRGAPHRAEGTGRDGEAVLDEILTELRAIRSAVESSGSEAADTGASTAIRRTAERADGVALDDPTGRRDAVEGHPDGTDVSPPEEEDEGGSDATGDRHDGREAPAEIQFEDGS